MWRPDLAREGKPAPPALRSEYPAWLLSIYDRAVQLGLKRGLRRGRFRDEDKWNGW